MLPLICCQNVRGLCVFKSSNLWCSRWTFGIELVDIQLVDANIRLPNLEITVDTIFATIGNFEDNYINFPLTAMPVRIAKLGNNRGQISKNGNFG